MVDEGIAHQSSDFPRRKSAHRRRDACACRPDHTCPARHNPAEKGQPSASRGEKVGELDQSSGGSPGGAGGFEPGAPEASQSAQVAFRMGAEKALLYVPALHTPNRSVRRVARDVYRVWSSEHAGVGRHTCPSPDSRPAAGAGTRLSSRVSVCRLS